MGEDVDFLKDQVYRLNAVLSEYQKKYPPIGITKQFDGQSIEQPWLTDKNMSPLLLEYDCNMKLLKSQLDKHVEEQRELHSQVDKLVAENKRLSRELRESVEAQMGYSGTMTAAELSSEPEAVVEDKLIQNLQHQLQMALQEKDSAMEMWQAAVNEVERVERNNQNTLFNPRLVSLEHQANQIKEQYIRTVDELNKEIQALQQQLGIAKSELKISQTQTSELRKTLEELHKHMSIQEHEKLEIEEGKRELYGQTNAARKSIITLETKYKQAEIELNQMKHDNASLEERVSALQTKCSEHEQKAYEAAMKGRDNLQTAESAVLEKDEALLREKQAQQEVARLQETISSLLDQAGARTRQEIDNVRQQLNEKINGLTEEIHNLEMDNTEKQTQIERAIREKRAAESELEKIYQEGMVSGHKEKSTFDTLNQRACDAERLRDEAMVKMETMHNEMRRTGMTLKQEKKYLATELDQLKDRLVSLNNEFESSNGDRVRLTEKVDELQRKLVKVEQERDSAQRSYTKELKCQKTDMQLKEKEFEVRLHSTEDSHRSAMMELRQMLASQQRMSAKWKEECQALTAKFEKKVQDLREEGKREKQRNAELVRLLKESRDKTSEVETLVAEYSQNIRHMATRIRDSETRAANAAMQATRSGYRPDEDVLEERKRFQSELEKDFRENRIRQDGPHLTVSEPFVPHSSADVSVS